MEDEVLELLREHAGELLRFARRFSICADDAQDAYQRALEKLVRRMRQEPPENLLSWIRTVLRHESLQVRADRERSLNRVQLDDDRHGASLNDPAERVERFERLAHTAEALGRLKPQELTALVLRAEGLSYREICERTSWSYTRCNRVVTEGRRALRRRLDAIDSGAECERWLPLLSIFADGEATAREVAELRPHLRACTSCQATLRAFHELPSQLRALLPVAVLPVVLGAVGVAGVASGAGVAGGTAAADHGAAAAAATDHGAAAVDAVGAASGPGGGIARHLGALVHGALDRASVSVLRVQSAVDALPGAKLAAVAASTVAVAGGGAAIEQAATAGVKRVPAAQVAAANLNAPIATADGTTVGSGALTTAPPLEPNVPPGGAGGSSSSDPHLTDASDEEGQSEFAAGSEWPGAELLSTVAEWTPGSASTARPRGGSSAGGSHGDATAPAEQFADQGDRSEAASRKRTESRVSASRQRSPEWSADQDRAGADPDADADAGDRTTTAPATVASTSQDDPPLPSKPAAFSEPPPPENPPPPPSSAGEFAGF
ncbi:sigma-70 family RNA polymerase sigma factor [Conexibacter sp. CPCC 206217]|uniref:sigma-70 family RNA polymerase sigma factor n=1 Tax=Conexibacter sp. CPCC 206217 TaxID=3064574 RepID=UPI0027273FFB|nr:sigma-70 family RNA polymerase sigma factor [Conexibacter sp. CPCC 206217]MDO8209212.1 sigma-70 family RNA polymerase sigma factor [Conexibacter sp. CPCC 206217]